jgi:hypothetical protein
MKQEENRRINTEITKTVVRRHGGKRQGVSLDSLCVCVCVCGVNLKLG